MKFVSVYVKNSDFYRRIIYVADCVKTVYIYKLVLVDVHSFKCFTLRSIYENKCRHLYLLNSNMKDGQTSI